MTSLSPVVTVTPHGPSVSLGDGMQTTQMHSPDRARRIGVVAHASTEQPNSNPSSFEAAAAWLFYAGVSSTCSA